jgi:uncharacterized protein YegL
MIRHRVVDHLINHIVLVIDCSGSMSRHRKEVVKVADNQIKYLAQRSKEMNQETRVSVYIFDESVYCLVYDTDVLRLPSIASLYEIGGMTALVDATVVSIEELAQTATLHGDHSFLIYVLTDGLENASKRPRSALSAKLARLGDNWTLACFVPNIIAKREALALGFLKDNVAVWDADDSMLGMEEVGNTVRATTEAFMVGRAAGVRGTRTLFSTGAEAVNPQTVAAAGLVPLDQKRYELLPIAETMQTRPFVRSMGFEYRSGTVYYLLRQTENIQKHKKLAVVDKDTNEVYWADGDQIRQLVGLPLGVDSRVKPDANPKYEIYVQSTAVNRNLIRGFQCILLDPVKLKVPTGV